jgi:formamidopyrimidine-DNA glycosylase
MPELPEVETTRLGLEPHISGRTITRIITRIKSLRWPISTELYQAETQRIIKISRRGKYLLLQLKQGHIIIHLGMSGCLRLVASNELLKKHDHVDIELDSGKLLRFNDPRRFGCILWTTDVIEQHTLLKNLGPEPLTEDFNAAYFYHITRKCKRNIKETIMDAKIVVGVGNIYAAEALFLANIHPLRIANTLDPYECEILVSKIKIILHHAIQRGGTTIRDFLASDGKPGYFKQELQVYGREEQACYQCESILKTTKIQQRASVYCPWCQG